MNSIIKNKIFRVIVTVFAVLLFLSCQKDLSSEDGLFPVQVTDLTTKVTSSVSGFVTDENNAVVLGASVTVGSSFATTDKYGFFEVKNVQVVKNAAMVTVNKPGYFKGIKTYIATENKAAFFRIKLIPKANSGSINGTAGGNVTLSNGLIVALPANAVVNAGSGVAYSGAVNVAAHWIDPTATDLNQTMPGDLRGIATDGSLKTLTTYGMAAVELTGASGELLQIAPGKKATLTLTIPASIQGTAPATIPLWSFDETKGLWKQEGEATKTGNTYVGEVSHFSFWNCDVPANYVQFNCTIKNVDGIPIPFATVKITVVGTNNAGYGYTDSSGYVGGAVPGNAQLLLEVFSDYSCGTPIYSQNFATTNTNLSLGVITVNSVSVTAAVSGTVTDCSNNPVSNGYIVMINGYQYFRYSLSNTGTFSFNTILCNNTATVTFVAEDNIGLQQSSPLSMTLSAGANAIGNLQACGVSTQQFVTYTINGGAPISYTVPGDSITHFGNGTFAGSYISAFSPAGGNGEVNISFSNTGIAVGTAQNLLGFSSTQFIPNTQTTIPTPINVNITEYGAIGQFISGNFSGAIVTTGPPPITTYNIVYSFRVRRNF